MERPSRDWMDLVTEMLWVFERETKLTLRGISDDFKTGGLSFDSEFRNHFLQLVQKCVTKTYDQFVMRQQFTELENRCDTGAANADATAQGLNSTRIRRAFEMPQRANATTSQLQQRTNANVANTSQASQNKRPNERNAQRSNERHTETQRGGALLNDEENINENYEIFGNENIFEVIDTDDEVEVIDNERPIRNGKRTLDQTELPETEAQLAKKTKCGRTSRTPARYRAPLIDPDQSEIPTAEASVASLSTPTQTFVSPSALVQTNQSAPLQANRSAYIRATRSVSTPHKSLPDPNRFKCSVCDYRARYNYILMRHMLVHRERPYACKECPKKYVEEDELELHVRNFHKNRCSKCRRMFYGPTQRQQHEMCCTAIQYTCYMCTFHTPYLPNLRRHMLKHSGEQPFQCSLCPRRFKSNRSMQGHLNSSHQILQTDTAPNPLELVEITM